MSLWHDPLGLIELIRLCRRWARHRPREQLEGRHPRPACRHDRRRTGAHLHGSRLGVRAYHGFASKLYLWLDRLVRPLTTSFICVSERTRDAGIAAHTCGRDGTTVIPNAVDVGAAPHAALDGDPPRVISVGRLKEPKDFVGLVRALAHVHAPYRAAIIGDGPDRAEVEAVAGDVELLGERDDVPTQLADSDVFALWSRSEGMPMSVAEAMAADYRSSRAPSAAYRARRGRRHRAARRAGRRGWASARLTASSGIGLAAPPRRRRPEARPRALRRAPVPCRAPAALRASGLPALRPSGGRRPWPHAGQNRAP